MSTLIKTRTGRAVLRRPSSGARLVRRFDRGHPVIPTRLDGFGCACVSATQNKQTLKGLGAAKIDTKAAGGQIMSYASAGATAGSVVPIIGTAIGGAIGAAVGALKSVLGKPDRDKLAWKTYVTVAGQAPGRAYDELPFELAWQGLMERTWDQWFANGVHHPVLDNAQTNPFQSPTLPHWIASKVALALCDGSIKATDAPRAVYDKIIAPIVRPKFQPPSDTNINQIFVDWVDRALANLPIGETKLNARQTHVTVSELMQRLCSQPVTGTPPVTGAASQTPSVITPPTVPVSAVPPAVNSPEITALIQQLSSQGANSQQIFDAALKNLQAQGIAPTPLVQQSIADKISTLGNSWLLPVGIGAAALFLVLLVSKRGGRR